MCCECGVTRLPTYDHSAHVWKRREGVNKDEEKGEGDVSICYCRLQFFLRQRLHYYVHISSQCFKRQNNSLSFSVTGAGQ